MEENLMIKNPGSGYCCTITPFDETGALDEMAMRLIVDRLARAGLGAFVGTSSPGEGFALSLAETERLYGVTKEAMNGRGQARGMGVEPHNADESYELIKIAESVGLDAMQLYCLDLSHGNMPRPEELERFFRVNLERMKIPAVLSTHQWLGYVIPLDVIERLINDYPNIIGVVCTTSDLGYLARLIEIADGKCEVHVGGAQQTLTAWALGGHGFLCPEGTIAPELCGSLVRLYNEGDYPGLFAAYQHFMRLVSIKVGPGGSLRFTKAAMRALGMPGWHIRPPYLGLDDNDVDQLGKALRELGITFDEPVPA
jgi:4-hydroxy-tetrahydrodipicolinate synthase